MFLHIVHIYAKLMNLRVSARFHLDVQLISGITLDLKLKLLSNQSYN
jgi:hypothetical protein